MRYIEPPPPLFARRNDPETSRTAGKAATDKHPDRVAASWVLRVVGETPMNDEEIVTRLHAIGCPLSPQRIRGGRKHLADLGMVECAGKVPLASGHAGRSWIRRQA